MVIAIFASAAVFAVRFALVLAIARVVSRLGVGRRVFDSVHLATWIGFVTGLISFFLFRIDSPIGQIVIGVAAVALLAYGWAEEYRADEGNWASLNSINRGWLFCAGYSFPIGRPITSWECLLSVLGLQHFVSSRQIKHLPAKGDNNLKFVATFQLCSETENLSLFKFACTDAILGANSAFKLYAKTPDRKLSILTDYKANNQFVTIVLLNLDFDPPRKRIYARSEAMPSS